MNNCKILEIPTRKVNQVKKDDISNKLHIEQRIARKKLLAELDRCDSHIEFLDAYCKKIRQTHK